MPLLLYFAIAWLMSWLMIAALLVYVIDLCIQYVVGLYEEISYWMSSKLRRSG